MGIPPKTLDVLLENTIEMDENDGGLHFDLGDPPLIRWVVFQASQSSDQLSTGGFRWPIHSMEELWRFRDFTKFKWRKKHLPSGYLT